MSHCLDAVRQTPGSPRGRRREWHQLRRSSSRHYGQGRPAGQRTVCWGHGLRHPSPHTHSSRKLYEGKRDKVGKIDLAQRRSHLKLVSARLHSTLQFQSGHGFLSSKSVTIRMSQMGTRRLRHRGGQGRPCRMGLSAELAAHVPGSAPGADLASSLPPVPLSSRDKAFPESSKAEPFVSPLSQGKSGSRKE